MAAKRLRNISHILSENWIAITIFLIAIFLRFVKLEQFATFLGDQGRDAIIVKRIVTFEHFPAIGATSSVGGIFLGPFFYYLMAPFLWLFRLHPVGMTVGTALLSIIGIVASYWIVLKHTNRLNALIFLTLISFSLVNVEFARFAWNPNLLPIFSFIALYFFWRMTEEKGYRNAILFGAFFSLSLQLHYLALFLLPAVGIVSLSTLIKGKSLQFLKKAAISFISFTVVFLPLIIFDLRHEFLNSKSFLRLFTNHDVVTQSSSWGRFMETNQNFFNHVLQLSLTPQIAGIFFLVIALYFGYKKAFITDRFLQIHFVVFITYLFFFSLLNSFRYPHYYAAIYYSFFLIASTLIGSIKHMFFRTSVALIVVGVYILLNAPHFYFVNSQGSDQIGRARLIAQSILDHHPANMYQLTAVPFTEVDGHVRYFLEVLGRRPLAEDAIEQPEELYILCYEKKCDALNHPQWQIASFKNKKIDTMWSILNITIYKVVHEK